MTFDFTIDEELAGVFKSEVKTLLSSIEKETGKMSINHGVSYDLMRAFHTMGSVSALAQAVQISELAYAAESMVIPFVDQSKKDPDMVIRPIDEDIIRMCNRIKDTMVSSLATFFENGSHADISDFIGEVKEFSSHYVLHEDTVVVTGHVNSKPAITIKEALDDNRISDINDDIEPELLGIFLEEIPSLLEELSSGIDSYLSDNSNVESLKSVKRALHTIKGGARMGGALKSGQLFHITESVIDDSIAGGGLSDSVLNDSRDAIAKACLILRKNFIDFIGPQAALNIDDFVIEKVDDEIRKSTKKKIIKGGNGKLETRFSKDAVKLFNSISDSSVRVSQKSLETMLSISGESTILRSRMDSLVRTVLENAPQMSVTLDRLRRIIRDIEIQGELMINSGNRNTAEAVVINYENFEAAVTTDFLTTDYSEPIIQKVKEKSFDPLQLDRFTKLQEMMRMASESINDLDVMYESVNKNIDATRAIADKLEIHGSDIHALLTSAQMVGLDSMVGRFRKTVSQAAIETKKSVRIEMSGDGKIDRQALEKLSGAIDHILRNGVAHGIEDKYGRVKSGKPEEGLININTFMDGDEVIVEIVDDGNGINKDKVRQKAISQGLINDSDVMSDEDLVNLIFASGFSTADTVSTIAGRGVGLDAVKKDIESMGGLVRVSSEAGKGSKFTLRIRSTIATIPVLPMKMGDFWYAIPALSISRVVQQKPDWDGKHITVDGHTYVLSNIYGELIEVDDSKLDIRCAIIRDSNVAVHVDNLAHGRELIMKKLGKQSASLPGVIGASVMEDGATALIINPARIVSLTKAREAKKVSFSNVERRKRVLVVDDSLTVRKATQRFLEKSGFDVALAVDGQDGFEKIDNFMPDIILSDIEMPRMDGFELVKSVRASVRFSEIPIIMISSRAIDTHVNHAMSIGANGYFGKPYIESEILGKISELTGKNNLEAA